MNRNPLSSLIALSILGAMLEAQKVQRNKAAPPKDAESNAGAAPGDQSITDFIQEKFGLHAQDRAAATAIPTSPKPRMPEPKSACDCPSCSCDPMVVNVVLPIPPSIANAAGMTQPDFDISSPTGRVVGLLAAARAQMEALADTEADVMAKARLSGASANAQIAIDVLQNSFGCVYVDSNSDSSGAHV